METSAQDDLVVTKWLDFVVSAVDYKVSVDVLDTTLYYLAKFENESSLRLANPLYLQVVRRLDSDTYIVKFKSVNQYVAQPIKLYKTNNRWKVSSNIRSSSRAEPLSSYFIKTTVQEELIKLINAHSYSFNSIDKNLIQLFCPTEFLTEIMDLSSVTYIGLESVNTKRESTVLDLNLVPNGVSKLHHEYPNLNGNGLTLSIKEELYNLSDIDLRGRHLQSKLQAETISNHTTDMATIAAGAGNSSPNGKGVAPRATITSSDFSNIFPDVSEDFKMLNAWVQNHSYGTEIENFYGVLAQAYDQSTNENPELLHVFSIGNQGLNGFSTATGNYKMSKNTLSIGSVDTVGRSINFVSKGPAYDGRVKPELVSYSVNGSSNSAALVSGTVLLLQEQYQNQFQLLPPSALIKALLINSAEDVGAIGVDFTTGYGNLNAYRAIETIKANQSFSGEVSEDETKEYQIEIPNGASNIKVTLVWNDLAAEINSNIALVNDLDLSVETIDGTIMLPWVLDENPEGLSKTAVRKKDHLNNVEQVSFPYSNSKKITVKINGFNIEKGAQKFFVAYQWDEPDLFVWNFPTGSDNMPYNGETVGYFRWKSTFSAITGTLEFSLDKGATWQLIDNNIDLTKGYYRWNPPLINSGAIARITLDGQSFETEPFVISRPKPFSVGFDCADSVRLQWATYQGASSYEVYTFGNKFIERQITVTDTSYTFFKSEFGTSYFSIQPVLNDGTRPLRSTTADFSLQGVGCYLASFSTEAANEEGIYLNMALGTTAGIEQLTIERETNTNGFKQIALLNREELKRNLKSLDSAPLQGLNRYRLKILFQNREEYYSNISEAYFLTTQPFLIFPNPVSLDDRLNIFTRVLEPNQSVIFTLMDHSGKKIHEETLSSDTNSIKLDGLTSGIYIYHLSTRGFDTKGKVIIN
jgi:hypothetical protein